MAIPFLDNINIKKKVPNVERDLFETIEAMVAYPENYLPAIFECNVVETGKRYRYNVSNSIDETLGKWREIVESNGRMDPNDYYKKTKVDELLDNKVNVEVGKGLSTNDLTDELKAQYDKAEENVQSDWYETDETVDSFIKGKPTKLSDFNNDEEFITKAVDNLENYYKSSETYTKSEVNALVNAINSFELKKVDVLPAVEDINPHCIYFVRHGGNEGNLFDEFIYIDEKWENLGPAVLPTSSKAEEVTYENPKHLELDNVQKALDAVIERVESVPKPTTADKVLLSALKDEKPIWTEVDKDKVGGTTQFIGTQEEWDNLTLEEKAKYDGKEVIFTDSDEVGAGSSKNIEGLPYFVVGMENGNTPGLIRSRRTIKKLIVIGNSLTGIESTYTRQNGEEFQESRELGCCHPENQWTSTVYKYITQNVNSNFKMYKCLGKDWEAQEAGTKDLSSIINRTMYKVSETVATPSEYTLSSILDEDVDAIIIDLYENMRGVGGTSESDVSWTEDDIKKTQADYEKLYRDLHAKASNAVLYQFAGFMHHKAKSTAVVRACCNTSDIIKINDVYIKQPRPQLVYHVGYNKTSSQIDSNGGFKYDDLLCKAGDTVYDVDGNPWQEIADNWTSHPGDVGYQNIAILMLYNLFNVQSRNDEFLFSPNKKSTIDSIVNYFPNYSIQNGQGAIYSFYKLEDYNQLFDYMQYPFGRIYGAAYTFDSADEDLTASYVKITIEGSSGTQRTESISPIARKGSVSNVASRCTGSLYNTKFSYQIDDNRISKFNTYSAEKIESLVGGQSVDRYVLLAEAKFVKEQTFTNINFSGYSQIVIALFNGDSVPVLLKFTPISGIPFSFKVFSEATLSYTYELALEGFDAYSTKVVFTKNSNTKMIDGCTITQNDIGYNTCCTRIYGVK